MPTNTYTALANVTLTGSDSEVVFASIPSGYRDLILVVAGTINNTTNPRVRLNADTGNNYSNVWMGGSGSSATSGSNSSVNYLYAGVMFTDQSNNIMQIMDYSATDKHKTMLTRGNAATSTSGQATSAWAGRWANNAAVTSVTFLIDTYSMNSGTTLSLYGVIA
jgi:hypothetical protein